LYCFVDDDGQSIANILCLTQRKHVDIYHVTQAPYYISNKTTSARDRFASWLRYRCEPCCRGTRQPYNCHEVRHQRSLRARAIESWVCCSQPVCPLLIINVID
jgi:hypothetical protein